MRPTSLIIEIPSRIRKTTWARSLGKHNYICLHLDFNYATFHQDVLYNVIDDVALSYLCIKHYRELIGAQRDWKTNRKYGKTIQIKDGILSIVLCNPGHDSSYRVYLDKLENMAFCEWTKNADFEFLHDHIYTMVNNGDCDCLPSTVTGREVKAAGLFGKWQLG